jgi:hypothetical protein
MLELVPANRQQFDLRAGLIATGKRSFQYNTYGQFVQLDVKVQEAVRIFKLLSRQNTTC